MVAEHHVRALDADLPLLADRQDGLVVRDDVSRIGVPVLLIASEGDEPAAESLETFFERAGEFKER
ncbi:MAG: hypothetical protein AAB576_08830, partial [Elusimicrobiota bacterium]